MELKRPFYEILSWPATELQYWAAHYQLEYEKAHPPIITSVQVSPEEALAQFKQLMR